MKKCYSFICVCFLLISYITNVFANESKNNNDPTQQLLVRNIKLMLPLKLDAFTTLVDVSINNEMLDFYHEIKDIPAERFNDPQREKIIHDISVMKYCKYDPKDAMLKAFFPNGFNYNYYVEGKQVLEIHVDKSDCKTN